MKKRKPGRPPIYGKRVPLGLRVTEKTKRRLDRAAAVSGRSQSQEAELRLECSFHDRKLILDLTAALLALLPLVPGAHLPKVSHIRARL